MASRALAKTAFLLALNLLFFTLVTSTQTPKGCGCVSSPPPPKAPTKPPTPSVSSPPTIRPPPTPPVQSPPTIRPPPTPAVQSPPTIRPPPTPPVQSPPTIRPPPTPSVPSPPTIRPPTPSFPPPPTPSSPPKDTCPIDTLKLGVCVNVLNDLLNLVIGSTPKTECCSLIGGLADLDAAVCLCTAIKANVLGINLNIPVSLSLLLNYCDKKVPSGFQCA